MKSHCPTGPRRRQNGFTLIELLVVVAIIGILTTISVASFNSFSRNQTVKIAAADLKSDIRLAKTYSSSGKKAEICYSDSFHEDGSPGSDKRDDFTLIGHYLTFTADDTSPFTSTFEAGQRCQVSSSEPAFLTAVGGVTPIVADTKTKRISQNVHVDSIEAFDISGTSCYSTTSGTVTVEFLTVNAGSDPGSANTGFYLGTVSAGGTPSDLCPNVQRLVLILESAETTASYQVTIENTGNIYERKI